MGRFAGVVVLFLLAVLITFPVLAKEESPSPSRALAPRAVMPKPSKKGAVVKPGAFQVKTVEFMEVNENNQSFLAAGIIFNKDIDPTSVQQNVNIRMLKKDASHIWRDASTQNNKVRIGKNFIVWGSGAPLENGYYVMHLRGTIKSKDGVFLDCNKDGKGEGGALPPYESAIYQVNIVQPGMIDSGRMESIIDSLRP